LPSRSAPAGERRLATRNLEEWGGLSELRKKQAEGYLKEHDIDVDAVVSMPVLKSGVKGRPMLLLLDEQGKLEGKVKRITGGARDG
jgi:hypothetical protein